MFELGNLDELILAERLTLLFDADHQAANGFRLADRRTRVNRGEHFNLLAANLIEKVPHRRVAGQVDGERLQGQFNRLQIIVGDGGDLLAAAILDDHALEHVVDAFLGEGEVDAGLAVNLAFALVVGDAAAEEHDLVDGELGRAGRGWAHAGTALAIAANDAAATRRLRFI